MKIALVLSLWTTQLFFSAGRVSAQAFGEYGRAVGSVPHGRGVTGPGPSSGLSQGSVSGGGVGDLGGRAMPLRLVVTAKNAGLSLGRMKKPRKSPNYRKGRILCRWFRAKVAASGIW